MMFVQNTVVLQWITINDKNEMIFDTKMNHLAFYKLKIFTRYQHVMVYLPCNKIFF